MIYYAIIFTPCILIINLGLGSQRDPITIAGFPLNQVMNWLVILGAAIVVKNTYRSSLWPVIIIIGVIISKLVSVVLGKPPSVEIIYRIFLLILFMVIGIIYIYRYLDLVYKQVLIICLFNVIIMIFQVANVGEWHRFFYTGTTVTGGDEIITYDILFVPLNQFQYSMFQSRPTGFLRASGVLSGVLLFALALHFARDKRRIWWGTFILCIMIVLANARIVYMGYLMIGLLLLYKGNRVQKINVMYSIVIMLLLSMVYSFFFPALFQRFWTYDSLLPSFLIRIGEIVSILDTENTIRIFLEKSHVFIPYNVYNPEGEVTSGYIILVKYLPYLMALLLIILPYYVKSIRKQRILFPHLTWVTTLSLLVFVLYPAAVNIFKDQFYWMIGGFALSPLFILISPHYYRNIVLPKQTSHIV